MKKILLALLFTSLSFAQSNMLLLMGGDEWNPATYDANTVAYYNGNKGLTSDSWLDLSGNNRTITFTNSPTINSGTGKMGAVLFNGTDESGASASFILNQPFTIYVVFKSITVTNLERIISGTTSGWIRLAQNNAAGDVYLWGSSAFISTNPDIAVGTYGVYTAVSNNASSEIRTNLNNAVTGTIGTSGITGGITLSSNFSNVEIAFLLIRSGADDTATQNYFISNITKLCGL